MPVSKLEPFDRVDLTFKTVNAPRPLQASVLIPKGLQSKLTYPTIVNWHGGGFVVGDRLYEGWFPRWLLDLCLETPSLLIAPDYRLLPEANGADILSDLEDFWQWLHTDFLELTKDWSVLPDISRLACTGQSAGGYLAVQSALLFPTCVLQQAYLARWLGMKGAEELDIMKTLEKVEGMPPIWVVQGEQDSVVPQLCSIGFVKKLKEILPNVPVLFSLQPGDHGFEAEKTAKDTWVQGSLQFVAYWP